jgi:meiotically up-regulated gene 157 (Mug157) protein
MQEENTLYLHQNKEERLLIRQPFFMILENNFEVVSICFFLKSIYFLMNKTKKSGGNPDFR